MDKPWVVVLSDDEAAAEIAATRGHDPNDEEGVSEWLYLEDGEAETRHEFQSEEEAVAFAAEHYRMDNTLPHITDPEGFQGVFEMDKVTWDRR